MINKNILKSCHSEGFDEEEVYGAYKIFFGTLVSESRLKIINLLRKGKKNVSEIINGLKMDQTSVSHDLARLRKCGFVVQSIEGKYRYYSLNEETIKPMMILIDRHMSGNCIHILKNTNGGKMENNEQTILIIALTVLVVILLGGFGMMGFGNYGSYGGMYGMMNGFYGGFGFMWIFGWLIMIIVIIALVLFITLLIKQLTGDERRRK